MKTNRIISLLLCGLLLCGVLPNVAHATEVVTGDRDIMSGVSGIGGYNGSYDYLYFGQWDNKPVKWRVLDTKTNMANATEGDGLFLLSEDALGDGTKWGGVYFDNTSPYSNAWLGSDARVWCQTFYTNQFTADEKEAVLSTTKKDEAYTSTTNSVPFAGSGDKNILDGDKVFFLSAEEAETGAYGFTNDAARKANYNVGARVWWLRSPYAHDLGRAGAVDYDGSVHGTHVEYDWAARPAFNLNLNSVLFTSAAAGGKSSGGEAAGAIFEIQTPDPAPKEWKATLLDSSRNGFKVNETTVSGTPGSTISVTYSGAKADANNEYVSAIIEKDGSYLYYGCVPSQSGNDKKATFTLPNDIPSGQYTLHVFNEQCNGDYKTDYASKFARISLTVANNVQVTITPGANMTKTTDSGNLQQTVNAHTAMTDVVFTANSGYYFPANYADSLGSNGVSVTRDNDGKKITVSGTPTANVNITLPDATAAAAAATPQATFNATGYNTGTLTDVESTMQISFDRGANWKEIGVEGSTGLTNVNPCEIWLKGPGNGTTTVDSDVQKITVTRAEKPNLTATPPTTINGKGSIPTTEVHEYSTDGNTWTPCEGTLTVPAGIYQIRVKANETMLASESQTIVIGDPEVYAIAASPAVLDFGSAVEGYSELPAAQQVTITTTGNMPVALNQPTAVNYEIGTLTQDNGAVTFTVQPKAGLPVGNYEETITITGTGGATASVQVKFAVQARQTVFEILWPTENQVVTVYEGQRAQMSVTASGAIGYQWFINRNDGRGWVEKRDATSPNYTSSVTELDNNGYRYFCRVYGENNEYLDSPIFTLEVLPVPVIPETGDERPIGMWIAMCLLSMTGMLVMLRNNKRKYNN